MIVMLFLPNIEIEWQCYSSGPVVSKNALTTNWIYGVNVLMRNEFCNNHAHNDILNFTVTQDESALPVDELRARQGLEYC
ncbi:hypothetical protein AINA4_02560 [Aurantimicrobium sp. INA4]|nr:hypothetical protein AINA4_02560 [Aurantimicrobium sp. INA4]